MTVSTEEMGGGVTRYALSLDGNREFSAFMMDVTANGAMQVVGQQAAAADMTLHTGTLQNGTLRLLGIGAEQSGSVVYIDVMGEGSLNIENICFSTKMPSMHVWQAMPQALTSCVQPLPTVSTSASAASVRMS